jgi:hypothetical protein
VAAITITVLVWAEQHTSGELLRQDIHKVETSHIITKDMQHRGLAARAGTFTITAGQTAAQEFVSSKNTDKRSLKNYEKSINKLSRLDF